MLVSIQTAVSDRLGENRDDAFPVVVGRPQVMRTGARGHRAEDTGRPARSQDQCWP